MLISMPGTRKSSAYIVHTMRAICLRDKEGRVNASFGWGVDYLDAAVPKKKKRYCLLLKSSRV